MILKEVFGSGHSQDLEQEDDRDNSDAYYRNARDHGCFVSAGSLVPIPRFELDQGRGKQFNLACKEETEVKVPLQLVITPVN